MGPRNTPPEAATASMLAWDHITLSPLTTTGSVGRHRRRARRASGTVVTSPVLPGKVACARGISLSSLVTTPTTTCLWSARPSLLWPRAARSLPSYSPSKYAVVVS